MRRQSVDLTEPSRSLDPLDVSPSDDDAMDTDLDLTMPPSEDEDIINDTRIYTPPPRIAARFYRPSQARRKDSAASSRRNSISSAHSRSSLQTSVRHDDDQSKHVAQHLRRASFLEDRRARLADRAAHAEKVRLRAALTKAASRDTSLSEERALAAQQARERNLAEIVANCAEEVKKAKQVAEFMKEKREQELAKMKQQIEERMADAERRREELRNKSKTRVRSQSAMTRKSTDPESEPSSPPKKYVRPQMSREVAAAKIAHWWGTCQRKKLVQEFNDLGISVDKVREMPFDAVVERLAEPKLLHSTARLLRICGLKEGEPGSVEEMAAVRTFLSAYMILGHPSQVLVTKVDDQDDSDALLAAHRLPPADIDNPRLQDLIDKAKNVLIAFDNIYTRLTPANEYSMPGALAATLSRDYATFHNAFLAWKSRDSDALIEVMLMQFVELDAIFHTVKDKTDEGAAKLYRQSIQDSQLLLIVRIKKLAGQEKGKKMIFEAVREARKARKVKKPVGDTKPRVAAESTSSEDASATAKSLVSPESQVLTPPPTPATRQDAKPIVAKSGLAGLLPDNRVVVHELAINKEYQIPTEEFQEQQALLTKGKFDRMRASMASGDQASNFFYFMLMARDIKDKLQRLLKPGNSLYNMIDEIMDLEMAERQFSIGSFSYEKFFTTMAPLLPRLCAPFRDDEVNDLIKNKLSDGELIDRVEALNGFIDVMLCDYINYLLKAAAAGLIDSAAPYEAKKFAEDIETGVHGLGNAEAAWRSARSMVMAECQKRDPEKINHPKSRPTASRFYAQMLVNIFTQPLPASSDQVPEMLWRDRKRIVEVSRLVQSIITVSAVLLQCKGLLKRDVRSPWKTEAARIMSVLNAENKSMEAKVDGTMAALEAGRSMPAATKTQLRALVSKVLLASEDMASRSTEPREPVLRLLLARLRGNILSRLVPGTASDKVKATTTAGEKLASLGMSEFVDKVRYISDLLDKVGSVDRAAHSPWWDAIATKVEQEETNAGSTSA